MKNELPHWTKEELKVYILLLCANADNEITQEELTVIKSKTDHSTFERLYKEFCEDNEDTNFEKIEYTIGHQEYSPHELSELKRETLEVFDSDHKFQQRERYLDKVLDNILY
ncbi:MAG: hypothetical protein KDD03_12145 [Gelidibacter sp.]|nr:hypothetical protein [Gelidibacter sp.]